MYELMVEETFDAAHALKGYKGSCENLHGHTWRVQAFLAGETLDDIGLLMDFRKIKDIMKKAVGKYDHTNLNDLDDFKKINPSSENIAKTIFGSLKGGLSMIKKVTVWESPSTCASYFEER